jgi:hypothetical protein
MRKKSRFVEESRKDSLTSEAGILTKPEYRIESPLHHSCNFPPIHFINSTIRSRHRAKRLYRSISSGIVCKFSARS